MDLILWRHAEAHDAQEGEDDLGCALTPRRKQAARMVAWLDRQPARGLRVVAPGPAHRADAPRPGASTRLRAELPDGHPPADLLELVRWPDGDGAVLVVGHQPMLGQTAQLLGMPGHDCAIRKGAVVATPAPAPGECSQTVLPAAMSPEFLSLTPEGLPGPGRPKRLFTIEF